MKKSALLLIAAFAVGTVSLLAESYKIPVGEFSEFVLNDNLNVVYSSNPDSVGYVAFDTRPQYASYIMTECSKGKLRIQLDQEAVGLSGLPTVYVYSSFLSKVENWRSGNILLRDVKPTSKITVINQGNGKITASDLDAVSVSLKLQSGKGMIEASGKCRSLEIVNVGVGSIDAYDISAEDADCRVMGTGSVYCAPKKTLKVRGLGTGKIYYKGTPQISKNSLSTIKAVPATEEDVPEVTEAAEDEVPETGDRKPVDSDVHDI